MISEHRGVWSNIGTVYVTHIGLLTYQIQLPESPSSQYINHVMEEENFLHECKRWPGFRRTYRSVQLNHLQNVKTC